MRSRSARPPLGSIAIISAAALAYEVLLLRLLSIIQWHHFAYMIISVALLGYGVSGTVLALARERLEGRFEAAFIANAALFGLTALGGFAAAQALPFNALEVFWDPLQPLWLSMIYLLLFLPFFCAANCICLSLAEFGERVHSTYAVDLLGAGVGAVAVIALLYVVMPATALKMVAACGFAAALIASLELRTGSVGVRLALTALAATLLLPLPTLQLQISQFKGLSQALEVIGSEQIDERSSPLGLLTTVRSDRVPFRHAPGLSLNSPSGPPPQLGLFTDGDGLQAIARSGADAKELEYLGWLTSALPYHLIDRPGVLVLGAGAGSEVLQALYHNAARVDAVEINPQVVALIEERFGDYSGRPYADSRVHIHIDDARGFISGTQSRFDLIQVALLDAYGASSTGLQALGESYLYTVESFRAMLRTLRPGGVIAITRWVRLPPREALKTVAMAVVALEAEGTDRPGERMMVIRGWSTSTLLIGERPFSAEQISRLRQFCDSRSFDLVHYSGMREAEANRYNQLAEPWFFQGMRSILSRQRERFFEDYKFNVRPATDDRPYFFQFLKWESIPEILRLKGQGGLPLLEQGYVILVLTLAQSLIISSALILLPLAARRRGAAARAGRVRRLAYFFVVGTAFMLVEIAFIQKFILFLHHPIFSAATILGSFLIFAGFGSALSARWPVSGSVILPVTGIGLISLGYLLALPWLFETLLPAPRLAKIAASVALTAPLALLMGMPFPLGLRRLDGFARDLVPWAWGINGCASVISAVGATLLAVHAGFDTVMALAVVFYVLAAWLFPPRGAVQKPVVPFGVA